MTGDLSHETTRTDDGALSLSLAGALTVWSAPEAHRVLCDALAGADRIAVDLSRVEAADVAGLQLLCAAHRACVRAEKTLSIETSDTVRAAAGEAGFLRHVGCEDGCLWPCPHGPDAPREASGEAGGEG